MKSSVVTEPALQSVGSPVNWDWPGTPSAGYWPRSKLGEPEVLKARRAGNGPAVSIPTSRSSSNCWADIPI